MQKPAFCLSLRVNFLLYSKKKKSKITKQQVSTELEIGPRSLDTCGSESESQMAQSYEA